MADSRNGNGGTIKVQPIVSIGLLVTAAVVIWAQVTAQNARISNQMNDRWTGSMMIELQDELKEKNPEMNVLSAGEVRRIQQNNRPYSR